MAKRLYIQLYNAKTGESITLPLNPETTDIPNEKDVRIYNILGFGEVCVRGTKQLQRITLSNILPEEDTYFSILASLVRALQYKPYSLQETTEMINRWVDNDDIIRVIISGYLNGEFLIEKYINQVRENVADLGYTIELIEYRDPERKTITATPTSKLVKLKERTINKYIPSTVVGKVGQSVYKLAKLTYGGRYRELMVLNSITNANQSVAGEILEMLPL